MPKLMRIFSHRHKAIQFLNSSNYLKPMKTEHKQDHARLEKFILGAAATCVIAMIYLLSISMFN